MPDAVAASAVMLGRVPWDDPDAARLRDAMQAEMRELYGDDDEPVPLRDTSTVVAMIVLRVDGEPAACAALRHLVPGSWGDGAPGPGVGEVKRMYVDPGFRGRGLSRLVLDEVERHARDLGLHRVVLETGDRQTAAMALYERSGYVHIERYGGYADVEQSRCYAKELADRS